MWNRKKFAYSRLSDLLAMILDWPWGGDCIYNLLFRRVAEPEEYSPHKDLKPKYERLKRLRNRLTGNTDTSQ